MILETIATQLETPIGFPRVRCLYAQETFFKMQNLSVKTNKGFIVNRANVTPYPLE
jgi:hypothetical protein